jgi:hypothetical protein
VLNHYVRLVQAQAAEKAKRLPSEDDWREMDSARKFASDKVQLRIADGHVVVAYRQERPAFV